MSNRSNVEVTIYHTPERRPVPDQKNKSNIQSTIPSLFQRSYQKQTQFTQTKSPIKQTNYHQNSYYINSEKRVSKNQWELRQKIDQYETQIKLLGEYLRQSKCNCLERSSISRIFGFDNQTTSAYNEQQKVIKELGYKVKSLIKQNNQLRSSQVTQNKLNIAEIIRQNQQIKRLLQQYRSSEAVTSQKLILQNKILRSDIKRLGFQYDQKLKLIQVEYARKLAQKQVDQSQLKSLIRSSQIKNNSDMLSRLQQKQNAHLTKIHQIQQNHRFTIQENNRNWQRKIFELEQAYSKIKNTQNQKVRESYQRLKNDQIAQMKSTYQELIINIANGQDKKLSYLNTEIDQLASRLVQTNQSISHFKFERQNRLMSTIRKSKNFAELSPLSKGDNIQPVVQIEQRTTPISKTRSFEAKEQKSSFNSHSLILQEKIGYLNKEIQQLRLRQRITEKIISEKTQKILIMENQLRQAYAVNQALSSRISQPQIIVQKVFAAKNYAEQIKSIKQSILSCNINNFDTFENQFKEIIVQRDEMNEQISKIKQGAKQSSKAALLEKHLKIQRQKNRQLQENIKKYEKEVENLKSQVIQIQSQMQRIQADEISRDVESAHFQQKKTFSDGKSALEWQKVVRHCLLTSINRLQNIQNCMKEDLKKN